LNHCVTVLRRTAAVVLAVLAVALLIAAAVSVPTFVWGWRGGDYLVNPGHYIAVDRFLQHPAILVLAATALGLLIIAVTVRGRILRLGALGVAVAVIALTVWFAGPLSNTTGPSTGGRHSTDVVSPGSRIRATVIQWQKLDGTAWLVTLSTLRGPSSREYVLGCLDERDGHAGLDHIAWVDAATLRVYRIDTETIDVRVDPATAEPDVRLRRGDVANCYQP
jgi:hypothetical protein